MVGSHFVKVSCIPYTSEAVKPKRPSLMSIATGGASISDLIFETQSLQSRMTEFYVDRDLWIDEFKNCLYTVIDLDVAPDIIFGVDTNKEGVPVE